MMTMIFSDPDSDSIVNDGKVTVTGMVTVMMKIDIVTMKDRYILVFTDMLTRTITSARHSTYQYTMSITIEKLLVSFMPFSHCVSFDEFG